MRPSHSRERARRERGRADEADQRLRHEDVEAAVLERLDDGLGDVLGLGALDALELVGARDQLGVDERRHHDVDLDAGAVELGAQRLGEADDAVLAGGVGGAAGSAELAGDRGDVDDVAGAARLHAPDGLLGAVDDGVEVELELADRGRVRLLLERADRHDPGVVDDDVDRAELALDPVERGGEGGRGR